MVSPTKRDFYDNDEKGKNMHFLFGRFFALIVGKFTDTK